MDKEGTYPPSELYNFKQVCHSDLCMLKIATLIVQTCFGHGPNTRWRNCFPNSDHMVGRQTMPSKRNSKHSLTHIVPWKEIEFGVIGFL